MPNLGARFRQRLTPSKTAGGFRLGTSFIESGPFSNHWLEAGHFDEVPTHRFTHAEACWDDLHPGPPYRSGGPFRKIKIEYFRPPDGVPQGSGSYITNSSSWSLAGLGSGRIKYDGGFLPPGEWPDLGEIEDVSIALGRNSPLVPDNSALNGQAYDKTKPKIEQGGLAVAIAELQDVPHMMKTSAKGFADIYKAMGGSLTSKTLSPKKVADHFLNHNFGWVPFIKDLSDFYNNVAQNQPKISRLIKENGQWIRRKAVLRNVTENLIVPGWSGNGVWHVWPLIAPTLMDSMTGTPHWEMWWRYVFHSSAVGTFRYYLPYFDSQSPEFGGLLGPARRQLALFGARATPANIYKATPWTWLLDWVSDSGRTVGALNDELIDNMATGYLFVTHHQENELTFRQFCPFNAASGGAKTLEWSRLIEVTDRQQAETPFGFGPTWETLSPKQLAILAALGISRR